MNPFKTNPSDGADLLKHPTDFSLVLGGPLFQLLRRAHLSDDALTMARRRVVVIALLAWLPLLVLSALEGRALGGSVAVPFLLDVEVHIRYLVALPLLVGRRAGGAPAHAPRGGALHGAALDRRQCRAAIRGGHHLGVPAAQLGARRGAADRLRLRRRHPGRLAPVPGAAHRHLVRNAVCRRARRCRWPGSGTATSACRCSSSCSFAGTSASSSGRVFCGRCRASS